MDKQVILLAGGTGLIGREMQQFLIKAGHEVRILSRKPSDLSKNQFHWDPSQKELDRSALEGVTTIINLSGAGIADKRWNAKRRKELIDSRIVPAQFLATFAGEMPQLQQYISASGINCYGYDQTEKIHKESDPFGTDFLSQIVEQWESAADAFLPFCTVSKIRISLVISKEGGALETMTKPMKLGFTAALGSGKQWVPWIHVNDLIRLFDFVMEHRLEGSFNATGKVVNNQQFTKALAKQLDKKMWLPNVPGFVLKMALGEMSSLVLEGLNASSEKIKRAGFVFEFEDLEAGLKAVYK